MLVRLYIWLLVLGRYGIKSLSKLLFFEPNYIGDPVKQKTPYQTGMAFILSQLSFWSTQQLLCRQPFWRNYNQTL